MRKAFWILALAALLPLTLGADSEQKKKSEKQSTRTQQSSKPGEDEGAAANRDGCNCHGYGDISVCPLSPIGNYEGGTLYSAQYYNPDCDAEPTLTYMFGDFDWPWQLCPDDCQPSVYGYGDEEPKFKGLPSAVGMDYMHTRTKYGLKSESCFPGGPARKCCRVNPNMNNLFIRFDENGLRHAKVLQLEVNQEKAAFLSDKNQWTTTYVAFEVDPNPDDDTIPSNRKYQVVDAFDVGKTEPAESENEYVRHGKFRNGFGRLSQVLILLKQ
jgi:hypothetical protein